MSKEFINEVNRMKDLFGYKKGVVISEQSYIHEDDAMVSPIKPGSIKTAINAPEVKAELEASQYLSDESWKSKTLPDISLHGLRKCNMSGYKEQNNMECNQIWDDHYGNFYEESVWKQKYGKDVPAEVKGTKDAKGNEMIPNTDRTKTDTTSTSTNSELDTPKKIQEFQTWMDKTYPNWAYSQKYKRNYNVGGNPKNGFGVLGSNTKKAWGNPKYKEEYLKTLPTTGNNPSSNSQVVAQPAAQPAAQPDQATAQPAAQPLANATPKKPEDIYNNLWSGGLVQGDPDGQGRIRIDVNSLNNEEKEKLKQYMPTVGFKYLRTKNRDGRFVFTKVRQQGEE